MYHNQFHRAANAELLRQRIAAMQQADPCRHCRAVPKPGADFGCDCGKEERGTALRVAHDVLTRIRERGGELRLMRAADVALAIEMAEKRGRAIDLRDLGTRLLSAARKATTLRDYEMAQECEAAAQTAFAAAEALP